MHTRNTSKTQQFSLIEKSYLVLNEERRKQETLGGGDGNKLKL